MCAEGGSWTRVGTDGKGASDDVVELSREDLSDDLLVEVTTENGERVAHGIVPVADVWGVSCQAFQEFHVAAARILDILVRQQKESIEHMRKHIIPIAHCSQDWLNAIAAIWLSHHPIHARMVSI